MKWVVTTDLDDAIENATEQETRQVFQILYTRGKEDGELARELALWLEEIAYLKEQE